MGVYTMKFSLLHVLPLCLIAAAVYISEPASDEKCSNLEIVIGKRYSSFKDVMLLKL
jgi:hypothetical protein